VLPQFGWRGLYLIGGALPLLFATVLWAALPESPRFLARHPASWPRLVRLLARMGHPVPDGAAFEDRAERNAAGRASLGALFGPGLARDTAGLWFAFFFCLGSIYLVFGWLPAMLTARGLDLATASSGLAVYNFGGVIGVLVWAVLVTILGSRGPLLSGALACAGSALALLVVPIQAQGSHTLMIACLGINGLLANADVRAGRARLSDQHARYRDRLLRHHRPHRRPGQFAIRRLPHSGRRRNLLAGSGRVDGVRLRRPRLGAGALFGKQLSAISGEQSAISFQRSA